MVPGSLHCHKIKLAQKLEIGKMSFACSVAPQSVFSETLHTIHYNHHTYVTYVLSSPHSIVCPKCSEEYTDMIYLLKLSCQVTKSRVVLACRPPLTAPEGNSLSAVVRIQTLKSLGANCLLGNLTPTKLVTTVCDSAPEHCSYFGLPMTSCKKM